MWGLGNNGILLNINAGKGMGNWDHAQADASDEFAFVFL